MSTAVQVFVTALTIYVAALGAAAVGGGGGGAVGSAATKACGVASPVHTIAVAVEGDGDCLYNSVGYCLLRHRAPLRGAAVEWTPGPSDARRCGNMRSVLLRHALLADRRGAEPWRLFLPAQRTRAHFEEMCRRVATGGWGYYEEIALLGQLFGVCISVFSAEDGSIPHDIVAVGPDGSGRVDFLRPCATDQGARRPHIHILNTDYTHFEPLRRC